mgnify:CR=1 FL=1
MKKIRFFLDFEKEEQWLAEMEQNGYSFQKKGLFYHFTKANSPNGIIKIDYRRFKHYEDFMDYISMFEDSGFPKEWYLTPGLWELGVKETW